MNKIFIFLIGLMMMSSFAQADPSDSEVVLDMAQDIGIEDSGGYYTGTDVEAALQEIGGGGGGSGTMNKIEEADSQVGGADITTIDFQSGFDLTETPDKEINVSLDFTEVSGHDDFTDFEANEHIDWTSDQGATNIHSGNYTDTNTQLSQEEVDDYVSQLINDTDSVHTRITITYDDTDNAYDFIVDDMNDDVPEAGDFGNANDLDANGDVINDSHSHTASTLTGVSKLASANTHTVGTKNTFQSSATTAGFNLGGLTGTPSGAAKGDVWYNTSTDRLMYFGAASREVVARTLAQTLTTKTIALGSNTVSGTKAQFDTACTDGNFAYSGGAFHDGFSDFVAAEHYDWTNETHNFLTTGSVTGGSSVFGSSGNTCSVASDGDLSFTGTAVYEVAANMPAFAYAGNHNYRLQFSLTNVAYEFWNSSGDTIFTVNANNGTTQMDGVLTIGSAAAGVDYTLTFDGQDSNGIITHKEDESVFKLNQGIQFDYGTIQVITAATDALTIPTGFIVLNPDADYTLTSTPTIPNGQAGQIIYISCANAEANSVTFQDEGTLASSNLELGAATRAVSGKDVLTLIYNGSQWCEISYANN